MEVIDRIAARIPPARLHRHRYHGVLVPNAPLPTPGMEEVEPRREQRPSLAAAYGRDAGDAHAPSSPEAAPMRRILTDIGEPAEPPRIAPAHGPPTWDDPPVDLVPDWEALGQPSPEYVFDQEVQW